MATSKDNGPGGSDANPGRRQIEVLTERVLTDAIFDRVAGRHGRAVDEPKGGGIARVAIDLIRTEAGRRGVVRGEILVHSDDVAKATEVLGPRGFRRAERRHQCDLPIERFVSSNSPDALREAAQALRDAGIRGNPNQIVSFAMRGKSGIAPSAGALPAAFPSHPAPTHTAHVVVIDTGIAEHVAQRDDGWLHGIAPSSANVDPLTAINLDQGEGDANGPYLDDSAGHGTFVAGVIRQAAPHCTITVIRALDSDGIGSEDVVACAIKRAGELTPCPDVINLSLGQESFDDEPPLALELALATLPDGVIVVAAAGNSPDERPVWPAAFRRVVAVAALDPDGSPARGWSKRGAWVDVSAVGESVVSSFVAGVENPDTQRNVDGVDDVWTLPSPVATWGGTSFAAPLVSGLIAAAVGEGQTPRQALAALLAGASYEHGFGRLLTP